MLQKIPLLCKGEIPWNHGAVGGGWIFPSQDKGSPAFWQGALKDSKMKNRRTCLVFVWIQNHLKYAIERLWVGLLGAFKTVPSALMLTCSTRWCWCWCWCWPAVWTSSWQRAVPTRTTHTSHAWNHCEEDFEEEVDNVTHKRKKLVRHVWFHFLLFLLLLLLYCYYSYCTVIVLLVLLLLLLQQTEFA